MKTTYTYDHYWKYDEMKTMLEEMAAAHPDLMKLETLVTTPEGRNVYAVTLSKGPLDPLAKPAFYIDGSTHAGEVTGSMAALHAIDVLVSGCESDPEITKLLENETIYVIPRISPDGAETYLTTPYTIRSVDRVYKPEKGGIKEEDLDGDGVVRMMRLQNPCGAWKIDPENEKLMTLRRPDDTEGTFYDIFQEGTLEPFAGDENLKARKKDWSLDFNRNYPLGWCPEGQQPGAGPYPLSNPETHATVDFVLAHPNICAVSTNHTSGGIILYPPGTMPSANAPKADIQLMKELAQMGKEELGYEPLNIYDTYLRDQMHIDSGAFDDWCYQDQGIPAFTVELWDLNKRAGAPIHWENWDKETPLEIIKRFNACMKWVQENAPQYYADWKKIEHPQLGMVEVGGFNAKFTVQNPPENFLNGVLEQQTRFMIRFAKAVPHLSVDNVTAVQKGEGLYEISALIVNKGYMSTNLTLKAGELKESKPVEVTIAGGTLLAGQEKTEIEVLEGYSATDLSTWYGNFATQQVAKARKKLTWLVQASAGTRITIQASSPKAGQVQGEITL